MECIKKADGNDIWSMRGFLPQKDLPTLFRKTEKENAIPPHRMWWSGFCIFRLYFALLIQRAAPFEKGAADYAVITQRDPRCTCGE